LIKSRALDYVLLFSFGGWMAGYSHLLIVPFIAMSLQYPRKLHALQYYTFHAELLPHTE